MGVGTEATPRNSGSFERSLLVDPVHVAVRTFEHFEVLEAGTEGSPRTRVASTTLFGRLLQGYDCNREAETPLTYCRTYFA